jgi:hypothetical protein
MPIRNVRDAMHEMQAGSKHITSRAQAVAVGLKAEGKSKYGKRSKRSSKRSSKRVSSKY